MDSRLRIRRTASLLGLVSSLPWIATDVEPQEVHALLQVRDLRLGLVEDQTPGGQPLGKPCLDLLGLLTGVTQGEQIIGVADHDRAPVPRLPGTSAGDVVPDPGGGLHAVQSNIQQQRADHPALRSALLGRGEPAILDHARRQPLPDQFPGGERAQRPQDVIMVEPVECRRQVGVEHPQTFRVGAAGRRVDGHDRVVAATARPKPVGLRFEPGLPLGFQRVDRQGLQGPVGDHGNPERAAAPVALGHIHPLDRAR